MLVNLCSNAIKYNRPGGSAMVTVSEEAGGWVTVAVADTGIGIPREKHAAVFRPFNRLGAEAGTVEGTGVGLSICQRLVTAMGGRIGFSSIAGVVCRFSIEFPVAQRPPSVVDA